MLKQLLVLGAVLGLLTFSVASASVAARPNRSHLALATFPTIGTVYGRYEGCESKHPRFSLGIRLFSNASSTSVRVRAGRFSRISNLPNPPYPTRWFRYSSHRVQWLAAETGGEGGVSAGVVRVVFLAGRFGAWECAYHTPPRVTVQVYPRRPWGQKFKNGGPGGMLRNWPIR
ncbi:MAG TPA: hypothetical protein VFU64_03075 [Gaiellaceae bacterium]|nr:hypothetical protein [Gaiellaceae bacterium]